MQAGLSEVCLVGLDCGVLAVSDQALLLRHNVHSTKSDGASQAAHVNPGLFVRSKSGVVAAAHCRGLRNLHSVAWHAPGRCAEGWAEVSVSLLGHRLSRLHHIEIWRIVKGNL